MWRPLENFLYDWGPLRHLRRVCERLAGARVEWVNSLPVGEGGERSSPGEGSARGRGGGR